jgi:hypothetical protein
VLWVFEQDEIQARFQAQIHLLRSEVEKKDQLISQLEIQLESFGVQLPVSIIPVIHQQADSSETHSEREDEPTSSIESDVDDDGDDDSRTLRYFAVSFLIIYFFSSTQIKPDSFVWWRLGVQKSID